MTVFLNCLFIFVSVMFFAGRMYEVMYLLEDGTFFLSQKGIVTTPMMIGIVLLISICCGVLIFSDKKPQAKKLKIPVSIFGFLPAPFIIGASVLNIIGIFKTGGFLGYDIMMIFAALGLAAFGIINIKGKNSEKIPMILVMFMPLAMCMNTVILNVQPIADTAFLYYALSAIFILLFFLLLFKNAYSPSRMSRPILYIVSLMNFLVSGAASLANLIGGFFADNLDMADILLYVALTVIGLYSLFVAFYIMPDGKSDVKRKAKTAEPEYDDTDEYNEDEEYITQFIPKPEIPVYSEPAYENPLFEKDTAFRQANRISEDTIAILFAQKEEKEQKSVVDTAVKEITTEIAVSQMLEKQATRQIDAATQELKQIKRTKSESALKDKNVFKSSKKPASNQKVVYKAPKK